MNLSISLARRALEVARHELVTLHGLVVADGAAPDETFEIDTSDVVELIAEALKEKMVGAQSMRR